MLKNLFTYYIVIFVPFLIIIYLFKTKQEIGTFLLLGYAFVYRPLTDGIRLYQKGIIQLKEIPKLYYPLFSFKHRKELYFKK